MDTSKYDNRIAQIELEQSQLLLQMEAVCQDYLRVASDFIAGWYKTKMDEVVRTTPAVAKRLGKEGLAPLKAERDELISRVPELVHKHMYQEAHWFHRDVLGKETGQNVRNEKPEFWDSGDATNRVLGYLGELLIKYGFAERGGVGTKGEWGITKGFIAMSYRGGNPMTNEVIQAFQPYYRLAEDYGKLTKELTDVRKAKAEAEAQSLWDEA